VEVVPNMVMQGMAMSSTCCVVELKRCDRLCHNLRLVKECVIEHEYYGGGTIDDAYVCLRSASLTADLSADRSRDVV